MSSPPVKLDPFKPTTPALPGVPQRAPEEKKPEETKAAAPQTGTPPPWQSPKMMMNAGISAVVLIGVVALSWWAFKPAPPPAPVVIEQPTSASPAENAAQGTGTPAPQLPDAPGPVATVEEMAKPWSVVRSRSAREITKPAPALGSTTRLRSAPGIVTWTRPIAGL